MKLFEILEKSEKDQTQKAGIIPYVLDGKDPQMLFFVSSDPEYGGPDPQIAKGGTREGENLLLAAIREGEEELGLRKSNFLNRPFLVGNFEVTGLTHPYMLAVYAVQVKNMTDFNTPGHEAEKTLWMTQKEFRKKGRDTHVPLVRASVVAIKHRMEV